MEIRSLKQFLVLAEELHFGRAAERLHMTQPPLSMAIQKLEQSLGVPLFTRTRRTVVLTPAGAALREAAQRCLSELEQLPALVCAAAGGEQGRLRLGFVSTVGYGAMPQWLRGFRERYPGIALSLHEATLDVQLQAFERDELDAGFVIHAPGAVPAGFASLRIAVEPLVLAHAESQQFAAGKAALAQMLAQPLVIFPREIAPSLFDELMAFYRAQGQQPQIAQEAIQMQTIIHLVSAGMGVAWVPEAVSALQREGVQYQRLSARQLPAGLPMSETSLIWRERTVATAAPQAAPVVSRFIEHVRSALKPAGRERRQASLAASSPLNAAMTKGRAGKTGSDQHNARSSPSASKAKPGRSTQGGSGR
ncbi:LysR family transcriptional regulator [Paucibacter sp. APW11]|uniref:LysR family transcriptional regulator n=1 Tax=Roseateles aquae TaxID=3077235 RepID=A0ABU3P8Z9_9BURK|nr:LysR family transcriptional regulator [Paucibacter sp. APW11]MDT8999057.1 LysR family transcriptional regulator [Paucibacter sp. APW11]